MTLNKQAQVIISDIRLKHGSGDVYAPIIRWDEFETIAGALEAAEKRIAEKNGYYSKRIARLKSRSISLTLPPRKTLDDYIDEEFDRSDLAAIYNACRLECEVKFKNACSAAGIKIKGE